MTIKEPESMEELIYFTNRSVGEGLAKVWVYRGKCPKCGKGLMGKPKDEKTGKVKIRAKEYVCPECGYTVSKEEYEPTLKAQAKYTCPQCKFEGEGEIPYKRKKYEGMDALVFICEKCSAKIPVAKKLKEKGGK